MSPALICALAAVAFTVLSLALRVCGGHPGQRAVPRRARDRDVRLPVDVVAATRPARELREALTGRPWADDTGSFAAAGARGAE